MLQLKDLNDIKLSIAIHIEKYNYSASLQYWIIGTIYLIYFY